MTSHFISNSYKFIIMGNSLILKFVIKKMGNFSN